MRARGLRLALAAALTLAGCAATPAPMTADACGAANAVLTPVINAALDNGHGVEIETRTALIPSASDTQRWRRTRANGFVPSWRSPATDDALRTVYWRAWNDMDQAMRRDRPDEADRRAWQAAYDAIGDDRIYADDAHWSVFLQDNRARTPFNCAPALAEATGAQLVSPGSPRAPGALRLIPAAPALEADRALMAAHGVYPPFEAGSAPRETGTIWLLRATREGGWRVLSARRLEAVEG